MDRYDPYTDKFLRDTQYDIPSFSCGQENDTISRQAAIDALAEHEKSNGHNYTLFVDIVSECSEIIRNLPPAEPKKGKWIKSGKWGRVYKCNQCGNFLDFDGVNVGRGSANFCPNCGADMRGKENG